MPPPREAPVQWGTAAAALLAAAGSLGDWGTLSAVDEQARVVASTRWILFALCLAAGGLAILAPRRKGLLLASSGLFLAAAVLAWGEWRYEEMQAFHYGAAAWPWGLALTLFGCVAGLALAVFSLLLGRRGTATVQPS